MVVGEVRSVYRTLGADIRSLRIASGITVEELAEAIDSTPEFIEDIEAGKRKFYAHTLAFILQIIDRDQAQ